jgi:hypothetical protein
MANGNDIIIKGSSVDLDYDESIYPKDPSDPKKHKNANKKITRIVITGDINYDSDDHPSGLHCDITVSCR